MTKILVVDDNEVNVRLYEKVITWIPDAHGVCFTDPKAALEWCKTELPALVVVDYRMPEMDGIEATRRILAAPQQHKIIGLTTLNHDEYVYETMKAGASGFLLKDVRRGQLAAAIRAVDSICARLSTAQGPAMVTNPPSPNATAPARTTVRSILLLASLYTSIPCNTAQDKRRPPGKGGLRNSVWSRAKSALNYRTERSGSCHQYWAVALFIALERTTRQPCCQGRAGSRHQVQEVRNDPVAVLAQDGFGMKLYAVNR